MAHSIVPDVDGDANLFWLICCMIKPAILKPAPASSTAAKRGIRLVNNRSQLSTLPLRSNGKLSLPIPTNKDTTLKTISAHDNFFKTNLLK
jgi:hypothetical protein